MAGRHHGQDAATTHPFELEVRRRQREQKRGKRFRGEIDAAATQDFLQSMEAHTPPHLDEYEQAKARTDDWLAAGWVASEEIVRWRHACPGCLARDGYRTGQHRCVPKACGDSPPLQQDRPRRSDALHVL